MLSCVNVLSRDVEAGALLSLRFDGAGLKPPVEMRDNGAASVNVFPGERVGTGSESEMRRHKTLLVSCRGVGTSDRVERRASVVQPSVGARPPVYQFSGGASSLL